MTKADPDLKKVPTQEKTGLEIVPGDVVFLANGEPRTVTETVKRFVHSRHVTLFFEAGDFSTIGFDDEVTVQVAA